MPNGPQPTLLWQNPKPRISCHTPSPSDRESTPWRSLVVLPTPNYSTQPPSAVHALTFTSCARTSLTSHLPLKLCVVSGRREFRLKKNSAAANNIAAKVKLGAVWYLLRPPTQSVALPTRGISCATNASSESSVSLPLTNSKSGIVTCPFQT